MYHICTIVTKEVKGVDEDSCSGCCTDVEKYWILELIARVARDLN